MKTIGATSNLSVREKRVSSFGNRRTRRIPYIYQLTTTKGCVKRSLIVPTCSADLLMASSASSKWVRRLHHNGVTSFTLRQGSLYYPERRSTSSGTSDTIRPLLLLRKLRWDNG